MKKVPITAQLLAPVAIKRDRQSERSEGVYSMAGTMVRGALAAIYLQYHGEVDDTFNRLFLNESSCRFGPLDPGPNCFPLTAVECKREGIKHALVDQLWFRIAQHYRAGSVPDNAETPWRQCDTCKADLKSLNGFGKQKTVICRRRVMTGSKSPPMLASTVIPPPRSNRYCTLLKPCSLPIKRKTCMAGSWPTTMRSLL